MTIQELTKIIIETIDETEEDIQLKEAEQSLARDRNERRASSVV